VVVEFFLVDEGLVDAPGFLFRDFLDGGVLLVAGFGIEADEAVGFVETV